ncbi:MAG TPA: hypothetical protein VEO37_09440, partial [Thermoanaerobaculia bacterium]|nr:hypothetical protein [Thermoanaerobaculia bacterium]
IDFQEGGSKRSGAEAVVSSQSVWHIWTSWARMLSLHAFCLTYLASALLLRMAFASAEAT